MFSRPTLAAIATVSIVAAFALDWWWNPSHRLERAVSALARAPRDHRFTNGRLSVDAQWSPPPAATRGTAVASRSAAVLDAAVRIDQLTGSASAPMRLHARALAAVAAGQLDEAIDDLHRAVANGAPNPELRADLAAVLLERGRRDDAPTDVVDALNESGLASIASPHLTPALFNQALALETLGPRLLAIDAWQRYLSVDGGSGWGDEARAHVAALRARPEDPRMETTKRFQRLERDLLPDWARRTLNGNDADISQLTAAIDALAPRTADREVLDLARAAVAASSGAVSTRVCVARAVASLDRWLDAYNRIASDEAQKDALDAERALDCAHLPAVSARLRWALAGDRNAVYQSLGNLAAEAAGHQYFRSASLARIARGNSALRRAEFTSSMGDMQVARTLAYDAGDLELTATADAMIADVYRLLGDQASVWRSLQRAFENLPSAVNPRLVYSIIRAAGAAFDDGHSAASLPFSKLLVEATAGWRQPGGRIIPSLDRARALQTAGLPAQASEAVDAAAALVPQIEDEGTRREFEAEVAFARGRLAAATAPASAIALLSDALAYFRAHQTSFRIASVLLERGRAYRALGEAAVARRDFEAAAVLVEDQQPAIREEQLRVSRFSALWDVFAELERADKADAAACLADSERARARELLDSLAVDQRAVPLAGASLWNWLPEGTAAVVYSVLPEELLVWVVDRSGPRLREVPIRADALDVLVRRAVNAIAGSNGDDLSELSTLLLGDLPPGRPDSTLLIVPDGPLHFLPFAALTVPGSGTRLVDAWTPVVTPSLSVARSLAQRAAGRSAASHALLVGYEGDAASGLPLLRGVGQELDALQRVYASADVLRGAAATADAFARLAGESTVIHVAAHGIVNMAYPSRSHILLAGAADAQQFTAPRIARLPLAARVTVVLTACDTASGKVYRGEGQLSLARPFLIAGASSVIAAQMPVSDRTAPAFDTELAVMLKQGRDGARALAAVQRAWLARHAPERDWAVFSAIGSPQPGR